MTRDIDVYYGEFLISPVPLELSLNYCSHACAYCFANLNDRGRQADLPALMRFFKELPDRNSLQAQLVRAGYPVLISNRVDPFATSNYRLTLPLLEIMAELDIPVAIQTKGGTGVDAALGLLRPSVWYVSLSMLDDALRKRIEPGAPSVAERLDLMRQLTDYGHTVILGLNPLVPDWLPDGQAAGLLAQAQAAGARGVWLECLHFNYKQARAMADWERAALTEPVIERAQRRRRPPDEATVFLETRRLAAEMGLAVFSNGQPTRSDFWELYRARYDPTFPTNQDFVNFCFDHDLGGKLLSFDLYAELMLPHLPDGVLPLGSYLGATAHQIWRTHDVPRQMTFRDLLAILWQDARAKQAVARLPSFAFAAVRANEEEGVQLVDAQGMPYMVFSPDGFDTYYTAVEL